MVEPAPQALDPDSINHFPGRSDTRDPKEESEKQTSIKHQVQIQKPQSDARYEKALINPPDSSIVRAPLPNDNPH
jgi:hypothetical protein